MEQTPDELFGQEFLDKTVTISVRDMGEIVAHSMHKVIPVESLSEGGLDDVLVKMELIKLLRNFGSLIMTEMFRGSFDTLEIEEDE